MKKQMSPKKLQRELIKRTMGNLNKIHKTAADMCKSYGTVLLPFNAMDEIIKNSKLKTDTEIPAINDYNKKYNKLLDSLVKALKKGAKDNKVAGIFITVLKSNIEEVKKIIKQSAQ